MCLIDLFNEFMKYVFGPTDAGVAIIPDKVEPCQYDAKWKVIDRK